MADADAPPPPSREEVVLEDLHRQAISYLLPAINMESAPGQQRFADVCQYLEAAYMTPEALEEFGKKLRELYIAAQAAIGNLHVTAEHGPDVLDMVPAQPVRGGPPLRVQIRLWQLSFREDPTRHAH
jgi:hypothetical protein